MNNKGKIKLGELLIQHNIITQEQLEEALVKQKEMGQLLGSVLLELGYINQESRLLPIIAQQQGVEYVQLKDRHIPSEVIERIPVKIARRYQVMPIAYRGDALIVAMNRPYDVLLQDEIKMVVDSEICPVLASRNDIMTTIRKYYGVGADTIEEMMDDPDNVARQERVVEDSENIESEATIGRFLNQVFQEAYEDRATDIHIEPFKNKLVVRYRIDGVLYDIKAPENIEYFKDSIISRIKIMANLKITERRMPQDGRFRIRLEDADLDMRVSFLPTQFGESAVIRILNSTRLYAFDELNLSDDEKRHLNDMIKRPHGIVFITGPTGSGKTTTLYSCLSRINTVDKKIITIEDPVEYQLDGITQIQINNDIKLNFAKGLRSILRHDPDVIMVGEVRDIETAEIAVQVALTGHLIFSTLHTNDAASGVTRLLNMGVEPFLITSTVECFIAQRLVRVICPKCKVQRKLTPHMIQKFDPHEKHTITAYEGKGCEHCNFTGYKGRTGIFEILIPNEEISDMILRRARAGEIKKKAIESGMKTLRQSGWEKVKVGITTPEEVIRVTQERSRRR